MTDETKERMVEACRNAWNAIAYDILQLQENNEMSAEDAQDCTADYVDMHIDGWWDLTYEERHECLAVAIPNDVCI